MKIIVVGTLALMGGCLYFAITDPRDRGTSLALAAAEGLGLLWYVASRR